MTNIEIFALYAMGGVLGFLILTFFASVIRNLIAEYSNYTNAKLFARVTTICGNLTAMCFIALVVAMAIINHKEYDQLLIDCKRLGGVKLEHYREPSTCENPKTRELYFIF